MLKKEVKRRQWGISAVQTAQRAEVEYFMPTPVTTYTVTIQSNNTTYGTVSESSFTVADGTALSASTTTLTVGEGTVTATAKSGYEFVSWTVGGESLPETVTNDITITATFQAETPAQTVG